MSGDSVTIINPMRRDPDAISTLNVLHRYFDKLWFFRNIVLVSHTQNLAELGTLSNVERGAQPRVQHYQCYQQGLVCRMGH